MWSYEKRLQCPVKITTPNATIAKIIISQYGGPDGESAAAMRYLSQRFTMPDRKISGLLTDIGREASEMFLSEAIAFFNCPQDSLRSFCGQFTLLATV